MLAQIEHMLNEIFDQLYEEKTKAINLEAVRTGNIAASIACHAAIKVNMQLEQKQNGSGCWLSWPKLIILIRVRMGDRWCCAILCKISRRHSKGKTQPRAVRVTMRRFLILCSNRNHD